MTFTETLAEFLLRNEPRLLFGCLIAAFVISALVEVDRPRRVQRKTQLRHRFITNSVLLAIEQFNVTWVASFTAVAIAWWYDGRDIGLISHLGLGFWSSAVLALFVFELISYVIHRLLHTVPILWRIHAVHHSDTEVDFSTTFRNHPLELVVTVPMTIPIVAALGFPAAAVVLYQFFRVAILVFAHSNIRLPEKVDSILRLFITTPDFHRVHHNSDRFYTDSNFSPVLPLYDYLFGTAKRIEYDRLDNAHIGLDYLDTREKTGVLSMLLLPFYWNRLTRPAADGAKAAVAAERTG